MGPVSPDDETVSHVALEDLEVWGWGLNRPMDAQLPNFALQPNKWPSANFKHYHPLDEGLCQTWIWSKLG